MKIGNPFWRSLMIAVILATSCASTSAALAASGEASDEPRAGANTDRDLDAATSRHKNLFSKLAEGGPMMIPIVACSFLLLVFVFERAISLRRGRVIPGPFVKRVLHQLREGKIGRDEALELCEESQSPIGNVIAAAVRKWGRPSVEIEQAVIDAEERAAAVLRRYVRLFNTVANISPLLGLLGTVFGMIQLFSKISDSDAMGRAELLAAGISEALLSTAGGLCVAIPGLCCYMFFVSRVERLTMDIDELSQQVIHLISAEALQEDRGKGRVNRRGAAA